MYIAIQMEIIILYDRIVLRKSETLAGLKDDEGVTVWEKHKEGIMRFNLSRCFSAYSQQRYNNLGRGCSCRFFCCKQFIKNHPVILQFPDIQI